MTWFKVDDSFHSHPKVLATAPAALGLWVVAGTWSSANLTDGFVPDHVLPRLLPDAAELARALITSGLWRRVRGGHQFHDWADYQPTSSDVRTMREKRAAAGRKGGVASGKTRSKRPSKTEALASPIVEPPARPDPLPSKEGGGGGSRHASRGAARAPSTRPALAVVHDADPENPDWRTLPAYGQADPRPPSPAAAAARAAIRTRPREPDHRGAFERLIELTGSPEESA